MGLVEVALPALDLATDHLQMTLPLAPRRGVTLVSQSNISPVPEKIDALQNSVL